jgi:hypothetical protein
MNRLTFSRACFWRDINFIFQVLTAPHKFRGLIA